MNDYESFGNIFLKALNLHALKVLREAFMKMQEQETEYFNKTPENLRF